MQKGNQIRTRAETSLLLLGLADTTCAAEILAFTLLNLQEFYERQGFTIISLEELKEIIILNKKDILK